jgi:hypothetical protein
MLPQCDTDVKNDYISKSKSYPESAAAAAM